MSVHGIRGGTPELPERDEGRALPLPEIEAVRGQSDEEAVRRGLDARYGGSINRAAGLLDGALEIVGLRPLGVRVPTTLRNLPSFEVTGKDGTLASAELTEVRGPDGKEHPGVVLSLKKAGEPASRFLFSDEIRFPARPGDWNPDGIERHPSFGGLGAEEPLSLRHTLGARRTLRELQGYMLAAADFRGMGPGASEGEAEAAHSICCSIGTTISRFETIASRAPEAKLLASVQDGMTTGKLRGEAEVRKAIADLEAASRSIDGRASLSPEDKALVKAELATVHRLALEWLRTGDRAALVERAGAGNR